MRFLGGKWRKKMSARATCLDSVSWVLISSLRCSRFSLDHEKEERRGFAKGAEGALAFAFNFVVFLLKEFANQL
jgi:hypothetical protein